MTATAPRPEPGPVPVIVCDSCGHATPARFGGSKLTDPVNTAEREAHLAASGWLLTNTRDLCPRCHTADTDTDTTAREDH